MSSLTTELVSSRENEWRQIKVKLEANIGSKHYESWFGRFQVIESCSGANCVVASVPTKFLQRWISKNYTDQLLGLWGELNPNITGIRVVVRSAAVQTRQNLLAPIKSETRRSNTDAYQKQIVLKPKSPDLTIFFFYMLVQRSAKPAIRGKVTMENIKEVTALHFSIAVRDLESPSQKRLLAHRRQIAMYLCKVITKKSLPEIGRRFGGRDHTTVLHAIRKIEKLRETDKEVQTDCEAILRDLRRQV